MMTDEPLRPDPDRLLEQTADAHRGKLKIFFGACAGVGKTWAMLAEAQRLRAQGLDVLAGVVETHGRKETAAMLNGLSMLPPKRTAYRGRYVSEFDLDAALARRPALVLMDELAHSNAPGSRHPKRWQDIDELLDAGIDVFTTVNVQHLESLNDVVSGVTGIQVRETVPDPFFDAADEVVLVDLPPDDLRQRLNEGKVYLALIHPPAYFPMLTHIQLQFYAGILFREFRDYAWQQMYGQAEKAAYAYRSHVRAVYAVHLLLQLFLAVDYLAKVYHKLLRLRGGRHAVFTPYQQREAELVFK